MRTIISFAVSCLLACNSSASSPQPSADLGEKAEQEEPHAKAEQEDPKFVRVDGEQLAALCVSARLPRAGLEDYAALELSDGKRVPWLAVSLPHPEWLESVVPPEKWMAAVEALIKEGREITDGHESNKPRTGIVTMNMPCTRMEPLDVVVTGVFFGESEAQVFVAKGKKSLRETLPMSPEDKEVRQRAFRRAFEMTEKVLGGTAKVGTHQFFAGDESATAKDVWTKAAQD